MSENVLSKVIFDIELNTQYLDGKPCKRCHIVPEIKEYMFKTKKGKLIPRMDRSSRIDCDSSIGSELPKFETYHKECWLKEVLDND